MRIIGGKDYYDSCLSLGVDKSIVLIRTNDNFISNENLHIDFPFTPQFHINGRVKYGASNLCHTLVVVFCDKIYRAFEYEGQYYWSNEKAQDIFKGTEATVVTTSNSHAQWWSSVKGQSANSLFEPISSPPKLKQFMIDNKISILVWDGSNNEFSDPIYRHASRLQINPYNLKMYGFAKAVDPFTAFQELSMWIGGILGGSSPDIASITDDKVLIENHGYDKHSFRSSKRD